MTMGKTITDEQFAARELVRDWAAGSSEVALAQAESVRQPLGSLHGHWRSYGADPLPSAPEALAEPFAAFPSWFLRIECARCGGRPCSTRRTRGSRQ